jgi:hypothetical protein
MSTSVSQWLAAFAAAGLLTAAVVVIRYLARRRNTRPVPAALAATVSPPQGDATPAPRSTSNYFVRHWRGEHSLAVSFWVNGLLVGLMSAFAVWALGAYIAESKSNYSVEIGLTTLWLAIGVQAAWQWVGVWRSAKRHMAATGRTAWARVAQAVVILGAIRTVVLLVTQGVPSIVDAFDHAKWLNANAKWEARLLNEGTEVELTGGIGHGFAADLGKVLDAAPGVKVVHVNLQYGGLIAEAKRARATINARGLATYTSGVCVSACTIVFLGGRERYLQSDARLGFHSPHAPGLSDADLGPDEQRFLESIGVSRDFAARVVNTSRTSMWYPTHAELTAGGVVTQFTEGNTFAISGLPKTPTNKAELDSILQGIRLYKALKTSDPAAYQQLVDASFQALRAGRSMDQLRDVTFPIVQQVYMKNLPFASDAGVRRFAQLMHDQLVAVQKASISACLEYMRGTSAKEIGAAYALVPPQLRREELEVMAEIVESADPSRKVPASASIEGPLQYALKIAEGQVGDDLSALSMLADPAVDAAKACRAGIAFYGALLSLPEAEGTPTLRFMFAQR